MTDSRQTTCCGIIPAAGRGSRVQPLPVSKEIFPVGFSRWGRGGDPGELRPRVAADYLLARMRRGGARRVFVVLGQGKWDIPAYFGSGESRDLELAYLLTERPYGAPYTVGQALPFVADQIVLFGFPDILFEPADAFAHLLTHMRDTGVDIVLGLFPAVNPHKMDMVTLDAADRVGNIVIKPVHSDQRYTWLIAAWTPAFSQFMQAFLHQQEDVVRDRYHDTRNRPQAEYYMGDVLQGALSSGWAVAAVRFDKGTYVDIGTPEDLYLAVSSAQMGGENDHR
ncbi:MAG: sugar phosphate nucleotidyltransferase [Desulfosarcinaceae bacterium]|nr:sugar phosphate nucleotidyltransferase [Desulfosarcinaceae bacterium]